MCERARRSRDASSRYSIDTLFPTLTTTATTTIKHKPAAVILDNISEIGGDGDEQIVTVAAALSKNCKRTAATGQQPTGGMTTNCTGGGESGGKRREREQQQQQQQQRGLLLDGGSSSSGSRGGSKKRAGSPLKPTTQPKQMSIGHPSSSSASSSSASSSPTTMVIGALAKKNMLQVFQPWVMQTYGDSAKTKTITLKKYQRIVKTLRGEEINNAENSKFRFWVKAKGFHIGPLPFSSSSAGVNNKDLDDLSSSSMTSSFSSSHPQQPDLFVPTTVKDGGGEKPVYKRVAVVEHFFDIIYTVHVETEAKNGKHAGQKRTYRAITEKYAFLPREAVTKFLLQCMECQKRGSGSTAGGESPPASTTGKLGRVTHTALCDPSSSDPLPLPPPPASSLSSSSSRQSISRGESSSGDGDVEIKIEKARKKHLNGTSSSSSSATHHLDNKDMDFSLPFTTTYTLRQQQQQQAKIRKAEREQMRERSQRNHDDAAVQVKKEEDDEDTHVHNDPSPMDEDHDHVGPIVARSNGKGGGDGPEIPAPVEWLGYHPIGFKKETTNNNNSIYSNGKHDLREQTSPLSLSERSSVVNHEAGQDETSSNGNKDDEDDDDDESEDKIDTQQHDPERLKAFNMFVRLFVDENLDRMVPISKQPKEKIQAIIDSCTRQFPEFAERARKRIRTYLKSCRRNKRSRDGTNGWESSRPTPAHLTSVQAEQILAQACENESQNAKRMRMGLEPVGQPLPLPANDSRSSSSEVVENGHRSTGTTRASSRGGGGVTNTTTTGAVTNDGDRSSRSPEKEKSSKSASSSSSSQNSITSSSSHLLTSSAASPPSMVTAAAVAAAAAAVAVTRASPTTVAEMMDRSSSSSSSSNHNHHQPQSLLSTTTNSSSLSTTTTAASRSPSCENQHPSGGVVAAPKAHDRSPLVDYSRTLNGNGVSNMSMYRPNFGQAFQRPTPAFPTLFPSSAGLSGAVGSFPNHNASPLPIPNDAGPTDLSMKSKPLLTHKLNATEMATVRQLITGYRESAAFLLRSADELEQLLIQQQ